MAWCHQATSHYLTQCWSRSVSPYGISRRQCIIYFTTLRAWGMNKMTADLQTTYSATVSWKKISKILGHLMHCIITSLGRSAFRNLHNTWYIKYHTFQLHGIQSGKCSFRLGICKTYQKYFPYLCCSKICKTSETFFLSTQNEQIIG